MQAVDTAGDLRLRHQHRHQGRCLRRARTQRRRHPLRPPPVPDPGGARTIAVRIADATFAARHTGLWGIGSTAVASDSTHVRAYDQNLFTEWHSRYGGRGVLIYWHVEKKSIIVHSQLISCTASEVAAMVEGAMRHGTTMTAPLASSG